MADVKVSAVLLIPAKGDPLGLLCDGPCGSLPPTVSDHGLSPSSGLSWKRWLPHTHGWGKPPAALVLAWEGNVLAYGCTWLAERASNRVPGLIRGKVDFLLSGIGNVPGFLGDYGTIILLDADGKEVAPWAKFVPSS